MADKKQLKIGVFLPSTSGVQLLDLATVDVLAMMSQEYLSLLSIPKHIKSLAPSMAISYITAPPSSSTSKTPPSTVPLTANLAIHPTHTIHSPDVAPGTLDILVVPGPDPSETFTPEALEFLRAHAQHDRRPCDVLGVCTGIFVCAAAGILRGKQACGPRGLQGQLAAKYPDTEWVGDKFRWIQDGNVWSSGGITNGNDLLAAYARSGKHIPSPVAEMACKMAEVGDRGQFYRESTVAWNLGMLWQVVRGLFFVSRGKKD